MSALTFHCTGVRADRYAAGPTLVFRLRVTTSDDEPVHALALRCQIRVEPARRGYDRPETDALVDLFGEPSGWGRTLQPFQFAEIPVMVPGFTRETETDLTVPCTYDMDIAATRYLSALGDGDVPLLMLFSGTAFTGTGGFRVVPVPWDREAAFRMPVATWREMIEQHFPGCGWIRLPRDTMDALLAHRSRRALPSWEATVRDLLTRAQDGPAPGAALTGTTGRTAP
ncbi:DUF6084 family protein [Streptomyces sp. NPDC091377]|uniref:DUF6084 family protein n=1 Tax=unclassified Streptomyces TaxID=2593676 RepID=UPI0038038183